MNCIRSAITFSTSLPRVLRRTMGRNAFGLSYDVLFGLGMTTVEEVLKYLGQWPKLMQVSAMLMILERQLLFLMMSFQCRHDILLGPGAEESIHLWMADLNSYLENGFQIWQGLHSTSFRILKSTWRWRAVLKELWRAFHKLLGEKHDMLLYLIASVVGSFLFLTQFISSQGPRLLLVISCILLSKKDYLASLTVDLKTFQLSRLLDDLKLFRARLHELDHHCLECFDILDLFVFLDHICSMIDPSWLMIQLRLSMLSIFEVSSERRLKVTSLINSFSWSLSGVITSFDNWMTSSQMGISIERGAWSEDSWDFKRMVWQSNSIEPLWRNIRSMTKLDSPAVSENLVGPGLVGVNKAKSNESAIIIKSSLIEEWKGKDGSQKLSLMLKSPVIRRTWLILTSVSLRYFKAEWDESE